MAVLGLAHPCVSLGGVSLGDNEPQVTSGAGDGRKERYWSGAALTERK